MIGVILSSIHKDNDVPHNNPRLSIIYAMLAATLYAPVSGCKAAIHFRRWGRSPCCGWVTLVGLCVLVVTVLKIKDGLIPPLKTVRR